jgi:hypothetical protein
MIWLLNSHALMTFHLKHDSLQVYEKDWSSIILDPNVTMELFVYMVKRDTLNFNCI